MATLIIHQGPQASRLVFDAPQPLSTLLAQCGTAPAQPCGGRGVCGKCAVVLSGDASSPNAAELRCGTRLACQAVVCGDADVTLPALLPMHQIEGGGASDLQSLSPMAGRFGAAADIGTTTVAMLLYELDTGKCLGAASMLNPQTQVAADVIGRIDAALHGRSAELCQQIKAALSTLLATVCAQAGIPADSAASLVLTGNTTMLYLLTGRDPFTLSRAPFAADCLYGTEAQILDRPAYLPHCLHAFVGADTTCALLASGMTKQSRTALLCDVGTNGELALWHHGMLYITSTAAGPAFEGAGISCGCASVLGAIDQVRVVDGALQCRTIGGGAAAGICGSGLIDAVAALLEIGFLDETGFLEDDAFVLRDSVALCQRDIRAVQLAKAATYAGIMCLLSAADCDPEAVETLYLAGGFGSHLNIANAVRIGLLPGQLADRVQVIGNAALDGAAMLLLDTTARGEIAAMQQVAQHVKLDGNAEFTDLYVESMMFEEP